MTEKLVSVAAKRALEYWSNVKEHIRVRLKWKKEEMLDPSLKRDEQKFLRQYHLFCDYITRQKVIQRAKESIAYHQKEIREDKKLLKVARERKLTS